MSELSRPDTYPKSPGHLITAFLCEVSTQEDLYRLDFKLNRSRSLGSFLLRQASHLSEGRTYNPSSNNTASAEVLQLARSWIRQCNSHEHPNCRDWDRDLKPVSFLPTRLIELPKTQEGLPGASEEAPVSHVKLVEKDEIPESALYVTLSHRWGGVRFARLLRNNYNKFLKGIPLDSLPQTFRDTISLATRLDRDKIRYLWIDSLCIIQDDPMDWLAESVKMFQIYSNSYCNISATAAIDGSQGLFFPRDPHNLWEDEINLNTDGLPHQIRTSKRSKLSSAYPPLIRRCNVFDLAFWDRQVEHSPVNQRAWVLQERLLAPRVLHFCQDQIAWECPELDAAEAFPEGVPTEELRSGSVQERVRLKGAPVEQHVMDPEQTSGVVHEHWKLIVQRYSTTGLTKPSDKLIALAGIAEMLSKRLRGEYVAGMWEKYLASSLLWRVETAYENRRLLFPSKRPGVYRAPSFSWAAVDAPQGIRCAETRKEKDMFISVRNIHVQLETRSKFGPIKRSETGNTSESCHLDLYCSMIRVVIESYDFSGSSGYQWRFWEEQEQDASVEPSTHGLHYNNEPSREANSAVESKGWTGHPPADLKTKIHTSGEAKQQTRVEAKQNPPFVGLYLDSPNDDSDELENTDAQVYCVPAVKDTAGDLICILLHHSQEEKEGAPKMSLYRRVGLTSIPAFMEEFQKSILCRRPDPILVRLI